MGRADRLTLIGKAGHSIENHWGQLPLAENSQLATSVSPFGMNRVGDRDGFKDVIGTANLKTNRRQTSQREAKEQ